MDAARHCQFAPAVADRLNRAVATGRTLESTEFLLSPSSLAFGSLQKTELFRIRACSRNSRANFRSDIFVKPVFLSAASPFSIPASTWPFAAITRPSK
jgi:hypothetical protein